MKLKIYDQKNLPIVPKGKPCLHINSRDGLFTFNVNASHLLKLKVGDRVKLAQDEEEPKDWYLLLANQDEAAFQVYRKKSKAESFVFSSRALTRLIFESLEITESTIRIPLSPAPEEVENLQVYALITKAIGKILLAKAS